MPTENDVRKSYEDGLREGILVERQRLRAFIGLPSILAPRRDIAEHLAYPDYERRLRHLVSNEEQIIVELQNSRERAERRADADQEAYQDALVAHRQDRETAGVFGKIKSLATEPFLQEKASAAASETRVLEVIAMINESALKLDTLRGENAAVREWVDEMYATTKAAGQYRNEDRLAAGRDISSRHFKVFSMSEYLEGDERRRLRWVNAPEVPGGADFGYHWRRDGDDDPSLYGESQNTFTLGNWRAVWIEENKETAVFISAQGRAELVWLLGNHIQTMGEAMKFFAPLEERQAERNSFALLMDAYTDTYLKRN